jgi:hypothetical protein
MMVAAALYGVPHAGLDHAWGPALSALVGGIFGVWLMRVGINGTFSGNAPPKSGSGEPIQSERL